MIFQLIEKNLIGDFFLRIGIRYLLKKRLQEIRFSDIEKEMESKISFVNDLKKMPIALHTDDANEQHYEVPSDFFQLVLGNNLKYSSGLWPDGTNTLDESEEKMLELTCKRAQIGDGMKILDLGCGWGSLTFFIAKKYPNSKITSVSNSATQKAFIDSLAKKKKLTNIKVITKDMNDFNVKEKYDRIVSIEMLEHMKNYESLFRKISSFLKPKGLFFVHIFVHKQFPYHFEIKDETDWMAKYFFTGGMMPSSDLFYHFQDDLKIKNQWIVNGKNYSNTCEAWLNNLDGNQKKIMQIFEDNYGKKNSTKWFVYWRIFFLACSELFKFNRGQEWFVSHYLFGK